jgi:hypothetical protein
MLLDFVTKVLDYADYDVPTIKGRGIIRNLDISILASAIAKVPVASTLNAQFMQQAAYPLERGQVVGGTQYKLEDYAGAEPGLRDLWSRVKDDIREPVEEAERDRKQKKGPEDDPDEVDTVITEPGVDPPKVRVKGKRRWIEYIDIRRRVSTEEPTIRGDIDDIPEGKPGPKAKVVIVDPPVPSSDPPPPPLPPAEVEIRVDETVKPGKKPTIHKKDDTDGTWKPVPTTYDPETKVAASTVEVDPKKKKIELAVFTEGIPVGPILLRVESVERVGSGAGERTIVRFVSESIPQRDGDEFAASVADPGSIVHVLSVAPEAIEDGLPIPLGEFQTADAEPAMEGHQVHLNAEARMDFTVILPGRATVARIIAFTDEGIASVDKTLALPVQ